MHLNGEHAAVSAEGSVGICGAQCYQTMLPAEMRLAGWNHFCCSSFQSGEFLSTLSQKIGKGIQH